MAKKLKILTPKVSKLVIPYEVRQHNISVEVKKWTGDLEVRYDLCFHTSNSYRSICLSQKEYIILKEKIKLVD